MQVYPEAKGLFQRAILQSGQCAALTFDTQEQSEEQLDGVLQEMHCTSPLCTIENLKNLTTEELLVLPAYPVDLYREGKINPSDMIIGADTVDEMKHTARTGSRLIQPSKYCEINSTQWQISMTVLDNIEAVYTPDKYGGSTISATNHAMGDMNYLCYSRELAAIAASKAEGKVYQYILGHNSALDIANFTLTGQLTDQT
eukprot:scaffold23394_cov42-Cyclotella_meneghiniana.AAC.6